MIQPALATAITANDLTFDELAARCAPTVHSSTLKALVAQESAFNPFAIGVVGGYLSRQPKTKDEAMATVNGLLAEGHNFSVGLTQVNRYNIERYGETWASIFNTCTNLRVGSAILGSCYDRAAKQGGDEQQTLRDALSCYYSNNFTRGYTIERNGTSYVDRIVAAAVILEQPISVIPDKKIPEIKAGDGRGEKKSGAETGKQEQGWVIISTEGDAAPIAPPPAIEKPTVKESSGKKSGIKSKGESGQQVPPFVQFIN